MRASSSGPSPERGRSRVRALAAFAAVGPVVYVLAVLLGGALWPGYSHFAESISTLTSEGAPNQAILQPLFALYNLALLALALGLQLGVRGTRFGRLGPGFLAAAAACGLVLFFFPQGPWSDPLSGLGVEHTIVAGLDALFFLLAMGFLGRRLAADPAWARFDTFTGAMLGVGIVLGAFGAVSVSAPYAGLAERGSIGSFLLWSEVLALALYRRSETSPAGAPHARGVSNPTS